MYLSTYLSIYLPIFPSIYLCIYIYIKAHVYRDIRMCVCPLMNYQRVKRLAFLTLRQVTQRCEAVLTNTPARIQWLVEYESIKRHNHHHMYEQNSTIFSNTTSHITDSPPQKCVKSPFSINVHAHGVFPRILFKSLYPLVN